MVDPLRLRIYDFCVDIATDHGGFHEALTKLHGRCLTPVAAEPPDAVFQLWTADAASQGHALLAIDDERYPVHDSPRLPLYAYGQLALLCARRVRSHILIHAGAVSYGGEGIVLIGDSMHGKTTLVLELVRRGFRFLSDDIAALGRNDGWVYPYPRGLSIRAGTLELVGLSLPSSHGDWWGKAIVDIEDLVADSWGKPAQVCHIVVLSGTDEAAPRSGSCDGGRLSVLVDHMEEAVAAAIAAMEHVTKLERHSIDDFPLLQIWTRQPDFTLRAVEALSAESGILILDYQKRDLQPPSFTAMPRIEPIPLSAGILQLVRHFRAGHRSALFRSEAGDPASLFWELSGIARGTQCHRLQTGRLQPTADLICDLVGQG